MKLVTEATITPVKSNRLHIGDEILWSNIRCIVTNLIGLVHKQVEFVHAEDDNNPNAIKDVQDYMHWYKIKSYKEINVCNCCFSAKVPEGTYLCKKCKKEMDEYGEALKKEYGA